MAVIEVKGRYCGQGKVVKNGKAPNGLQRFHCRSCRRYFQVEYHYNGRKPGTAERIVDMVLNGSGVRDTSRVLGISKTTVIRRLKKLAPAQVSIGMFTTDGWPSYQQQICQLKHLVGKIFTQRIERHNLTLRTHIKRLARRTIGFSKSIEIHEKVIGAYIDKFHYQSM